MKITAAQYQAGAHRRTETPETAPEKHGGICGHVYGDPQVQAISERVGAFEQVVTTTDYGDYGTAKMISNRRIET